MISPERPARCSALSRIEYGPPPQSASHALFLDDSALLCNSSIFLAISCNSSLCSFNSSDETSLFRCPKLDCDWAGNKSADPIKFPVSVEFFCIQELAAIAAKTGSIFSVVSKPSQAEVANFLRASSVLKPASHNLEPADAKPGTHEATNPAPTHNKPDNPRLKMLASITCAIVVYLATTFSPAMEAASAID